MSDVIKTGKARQKEDTDRYNSHQAYKEEKKEAQKHRDEQIERQNKFDDFQMKHNKLDRYEALQKFAKETPNYQNYLTDEELEALEEKHKYDKLSAKQKLLRKLNSMEATRPDAEKIEKKAATTIVNKIKKTEQAKRNIEESKEKVKIYKTLKREGRKEDAERFAEHYMLNQNPLPKAAPAMPSGDEVRLVEGAEETKEEKPKEEPKKHNLRSKSQIKEKLSEIKQRKRESQLELEPEPQPEFFDEPESEKKEEPDNGLTNSEKEVVEKKYKKIDTVIQTLQTKNKSIRSVVDTIEKLGKTESRASAPQNLRKEIAQIYKDHSKTYHANTHLGKVYDQIAKWGGSNEEEIERQQVQRHKVAKTVKDARLKTPLKEGGGGGGKKDVVV